MALGHFFEAIGNIIEFVIDWFPDGLLDLIIRKTGQCICRPFSRDVDYESNTAFLVGLLFWIAIAVGVVIAATR